MAIYRLSAGVVKRSQGQSAVAAAAYRAGEDLHDERLDKTHRYTKKQDVLKSEIMAESGAPDWVYDREKLWNKMEAAERQWNGQPAREVVLSLPRELSDSDNWNLARKFVSDEFVSKGMVADVNFHKPKASDGKSNPHVHVLLTMRRIVDGEPNTKKERQWNRDFTDGGKSDNDHIGGFKNNKGKGDGWVGQDTEGLKGMRLRWAFSANGALAENGVNTRISALSNLELGKQHQPQPKMGKTWHSVDPRAAIFHQRRDEVRLENRTSRYRGSDVASKRRSQATTITRNIALDAELKQGLYGGQEIEPPRWNAKHERLKEQEHEQGQGGNW